MPVPSTAKVNHGGEERPPLPEDVYACEILDVTLAEKPKYQNPTEKEPMFTFKFGVLEQGEHRGRWLFKDMRPILSAPEAGKSASNLYEFLSAIHGRPLTKEDCEAIGPDEINQLIGKQVRLTVKVTPKGKNKVEGALKAKEILPTLGKPVSDLSDRSEPPVGDEESPF